MYAFSVAKYLVCPMLCRVDERELDFSSICEYYSKIPRNMGVSSVEPMVKKYLNIDRLGEFIEFEKWRTINVKSFEVCKEYIKDGIEVVVMLKSKNNGYIFVDKIDDVTIYYLLICEYVTGLNIHYVDLSDGSHGKLSELKSFYPNKFRLSKKDILEAVNHISRGIYPSTRTTKCDKCKYKSICDILNRKFGILSIRLME